MNDRRIPYVFAMVLSMPALVWSADLLAGTPPLIIAAAIVPAVALAAAILFAQRDAGRATTTLAFSLAWGALGAASMSTLANAFARDRIGGFAGDAERTATAIVAAPVIEEAAKTFGLALLLVFRRSSMRGARDGIVHGALIGAGFVFTENLLYLGVSMLQGGEGGLLHALWLRGLLAALTHVVFTASAGAVAGRVAASATKWKQLAAGVAFAIAQHAVWNAMAAPLTLRLLCDADRDGGACQLVPTPASTFGEATAVTAVFLTPGLLVIVWLWRREQGAFRLRPGPRA